MSQANSAPCYQIWLIPDLTFFVEWTQLSQNLPAYSGAVYTRWGRTSCPAKSSLVYKGEMAGPDLFSWGGGSNNQCLPEDPRYGHSATGMYSSLRAVNYWLHYNKNIFGKDLHIHSVPCAVCDTKQRVTQLMIPGQTRCPTSDCSIEYIGLLMSEYEHSPGNTEDFSGASRRSAGQYICVDDHAESVRGPTGGGGGANLHFVRAGCDVESLGALSNCPPYRSDKSALSCVVCSK